MTFLPGNQASKGISAGKTGRKGYEFEEKQLKRMQKLTNKYLKLLELSFKGKLTPEQGETLKLISKDMRKIVDKLHPNKQVVENVGSVDVLHQLTNQQYGRIIEVERRRIKESNPSESV